MDCTDIEHSLEYIRAGNLTLDGINQVLSSCPQICDRFYGTEAFDLAGPGVQLSLDTQVVLIVIFGTLQSFISYILPPHASKSTKLLVARLQVVLDTIFGTAAFLTVCVMATSFIRLRQTPSAFERIMIQLLVDRQNMLLTTSLVAYIVQISPAKVIQPARRWTTAQVWAATQILGLVGPYLKSMSGKVPTAALSKLCANVYAEDRDTGVLGYPTVYVPPGGNRYLLFSVIVFVVSLGIAMASDYLRHRFWLWLKKIFTSRLSIVILVTAWTALCLGGLALGSWQIIYLRQTMAEAGSSLGLWDFGQVVAIALWLPTFYQLLLTFFTSLEWTMMPNEENFSWRKGFWNIFISIFDLLYESNVGDPPVIRTHPDEEAVVSKKSDSRTSALKTAEVQKVKSIANEKESMQAPGLANEKQLLQAREDLVDAHTDGAANDEKAPLTRDHEATT